MYGLSRTSVIPISKSIQQVAVGLHLCWLSQILNRMFSEILLFINKAVTGSGQKLISVNQLAVNLRGSGQSIVIDHMWRKTLSSLKSRLKIVLFLLLVVLKVALFIDGNFHCYVQTVLSNVHFYFYSLILLLNAFNDLRKAMSCY